MALACEYFEEYTSTYLLELRKTMKYLISDTGVWAEIQTKANMAGALSTQL
jgi:hypothetical protein